MQQLVNQRWFGLAELILVFLYVAIVTILPQLGSWLIIILLVPWLLRLASNRFKFRNTSLYYPIVLIAVTAGIGIWAAYDQQAAWEKFWIIIGSVIVFITLINQERASLGVIASLVGLLGVIIAIIFLFNNDWTIQSSDFGVIERAGDWIMAHRYSIDEITIRPNIAGGLLAIIIPITAAFISHNIAIKDKFKATVSIAIGIILIVSLFLTSSRGAWFALILGLVAWLLWRVNLYLSEKIKVSTRLISGITVTFLIVTSIWLIAIYPGGVIGLSEFLPDLTSGESRVDLALNTSKLIGDFQFTGGGLQSFPGLYSQYMMVTPYFLFSYSHNFYLDMMLEQGIAGGLAILIVIIGGAIGAIKQYANFGKKSLAVLLIEAVVVSTLIVLVHGLVDDPLYGETGTPLLLLLPGIALLIAASYQPPKGSEKRNPTVTLNGKYTRLREIRILLPAFLAIFLILLMFGFRKSLLSSWIANLGAVEMSRVELSNWPQNKWNANPDVFPLSGAEEQFKQSLEFSPDQRTAWHRLGLISLQRRDYEAAQTELENAFTIDPDHRGIRKALGYAYVWGDRLKHAERILEGIDEAKSEMEVYTWWWRENSRADLSDQANEFVNLLENTQQ